MSMMAKQTNSDRRQQGPRQGLSGEMPWACNRAKGAPGLMGGMDGQKALGIELLSIQSMAAAAGRRWRSSEVDSLGLHGAAKDEVAGVGLGTKQGRRSSCSGRCGEGNRMDEDETQIWAAGAHLR